MVSEESSEASQGASDGLVIRTEHFLDSLKLPKNVIYGEAGMVYDRQAKYLSWTVPSGKFSTLELLQVTDMQYGHKSCRIERVMEYRDWILDKPNRFMLWTGDNVDAGHALSKGSPFEQEGEPQEEVLNFCQLWAPARHRILGYVGGNHERRGLQTFGDLGTLIATLLKIPYSAGRQKIDIYFEGHAPFKIDLWHGTGGARTKGTVAQVLDRFMQNSDGQLCLMGHLHNPMIIPMWREIRNSEDRSVILQKSMGGVGSSFLDTWGTYGEISGFRPHDVMMPRAVLEKSGGWELTLK